MRKESYFTSETIQAKASDFLARVTKFRHRHVGQSFYPQNAALLILDMQEYFLQPESHAFIPSASAIIPGRNKLIAAFEKIEQPVIATRHVNTLNDAGMMFIWWRDLIRAENAYSHYSNNLNLENFTPIIKTQYDAFLNTTLEETFYNLYVEQVVITGVMTHLCCESTARSAFMRGFEVFFVVDGTATYSEDLQRAALLTLAHGFALPVLVDEIFSAMRSHAS